MGLEDDTHSFVVKMWLEEGATDEKDQLRGHITHAYTNEQRHLRHVEDILSFIKPYIVSMGVQLPTKSRLILWLCADRERGGNRLAERPEENPT